jgi:hypothetical protein
MDLGIPVNYYIIFAKKAMENINRYNYKMNPTIIQKLKGIKEDIVFSLKLQIYSIFSFFSIYFSFIFNLFSIFGKKKNFKKKDKKKLKVVVDY